VNPPVAISVREPGKPSGGSVIAKVREEIGHLDGKDRVLLLIHGFNNNVSEALSGYDALLKNLRANFVTYTGQPAEFFWPGDSPNKIISTLSYPNQIRPAIDSGHRLATYLSGLHGARNGPVEVSLVGHSLGCRVILELLALWTGTLPSNIVLGPIVLMAAAVVVGHVDTGGQLRAAATLGGKTLVLHSTGDQVLHLTFPPGETAAGEGIFPTAVGRFGGPSGTWRGQTAMASAGEAYSHGSYWPGTESANEIIRALGGAAPLSIITRAMQINPAPIENRIQPRETPVRNLVTAPAFI
jgi:pimeloyl-ACP methyl ester carboxylesterase